MRIRIHRGAQQIGGNCVELNVDESSLLLDLGLPLDAPEADVSLLPRIAGLTNKRLSLTEADIDEPAAPETSQIRGVVVSHTHPDHIGLTGFVSPDIPVYVGAPAKRMLEAAQAFLPRASPTRPFLTYLDRRKFQLGPFTITPYLTDHSAFDAYSLLIEAGGKRVFYSGDLRAHGRKAALVEQLISHPPADIDVLILEGTTLSRPHHVAQTEAELETEIAAHIAAAKGLVLAAFSAQSIDRFVTVFKAARRAGRVFIGDAYLAQILRGIAMPSLPRPDPTSFRIYLPNSQRRRIVADRSFEIIDPLRQARIFKDEIAACPSRFVLVFRESMGKELATLVSEEPAHATLLYSLWPGYLNRPKSKLREWCVAHKVKLVPAHTSGHADTETLVRIGEALKPRVVIPIHTDVPHRFHQLLANVVSLQDGEWFSP